ncbi:MAG: CoB--CoM heterodisulfide reductase iron-sulfur subunit A family protein, partial [bacterium]
SEEGLRFIKTKIQALRLDRVVIAASSSAKYLKAFQRAAEDAKLNPYLVRMVNVREEIAWVHSQDPEGATLKAIDAIKMAVKRVLYAEPLELRRVRGEKRILVIGGGAAGLHVALKAAKAGIGVVLVERGPTLGGMAARLSRLYPKMEDAEDEIVPQMMEAAQREKIKVYDYSEVEKVTGFLGNFDVKIRRKARLINPSFPDFQKGIDACPVEVPDEYNAGLSKRKALYYSHINAVPRLPVIDRINCVRFKGENCILCQQAMPEGAVDYEQKDQMAEERVGAVIVATGAMPLEPTAFSQYHYGDYPDVLLSNQMERIIKRKGTAKDPLKRVSDGRPVRSVVFLQDVGSEDTQRGIPYASQLPEVITAKQAILVKEIDPSIEVYVFYPERRAHTTGYTEFVRSVELTRGVKYIKGKASEVFREKDHLKVVGQNTILGETLEIEADLVVLATDFVPNADTPRLAKMLGLRTDERGFIGGSHPAFGAVKSPQEGIYIAGAASGPVDLREAYIQAESVLGNLFSDLPAEGREAEPYLAVLTDAEHCTGCFDCGRACPFQAIDLVAMPGNPRRKIARILGDYCTGCGLCVPACIPRVLDLKGQRSREVYAEAEWAWT